MGGLVGVKGIDPLDLWGRRVTGEVFRGGVPEPHTGAGVGSCSRTGSSHVLVADE